MTEGGTLGKARARDGGGARALPGGWSRDLFAGMIGGVLLIAYSLSYAALIFSGPLAPWLAYGVSASLVTGAVSAAIVAARSSLPFTIGGPDGSTSAVTAALAAAMAERLLARGQGADLLHPVLIVIAIATALTGLLLCALGLTRAGRAIRFVPYPVVGGFLGATGWVMFAGAIRVITDHRLDPGHLAPLLAPLALAKLGVGGAFALSLYLALRRKPHPLALPGLILAGVIAGQLALSVAGIAGARAQALGWTFQPRAGVGLTSPLNLAALAHFPWATLPSLAGDLLSVMFVTAICILLSTTGVEFATRREANLDRELNTFGLANLAAAALGGYASCTALSRTTINYTAGARGRASGMTVAACSALVLAAGPGFLAYVPKFVLGGLLLYLGWTLIQRWLIETVRRVSALEYISLVGVTLIIVQWGFVAGVMLGVIIGCATFAFSASRVNAIKFSFDGSEYRSSLDRGANELAILAERGAEIQGISLQSYLFFGMANRLFEHVKALLARRPDCRFLVIDFRQVFGFDSAAAHSFAQIKQVAEAAGARLVLVNLTAELEAAFAALDLLSDQVTVAADLDHALEACENATIAAHRGQTGEARTLVEWLTVALGDRTHAAALAAACERSKVAAGDVIARQGDPTDCMHFILDGRVGIIITLPDGGSLRVRSLGPHTMVGEMGLITANTRSATIEAEAPTVLYALSAAAYERIQRENPNLGQALLAYVIAVMAERLSFANRIHGVLQR
jgi:SulP family sulfate permease